MTDTLTLREARAVWTTYKAARALMGHPAADVAHKATRDAILAERRLAELLAEPMPALSTFESETLYPYGTPTEPRKWAP